MLSDTEDDLPRLRHERDAAYLKCAELEHRITMLESQRSVRRQQELAEYLQSKGNRHEAP